MADLILPDEEIEQGFAPSGSNYNPAPVDVDPSYFDDPVLKPIPMPGSQRVLGDLGAGNQLAQAAPVQLEAPQVEAPAVQAPMSTTDQAFGLTADAIQKQFELGQKRAAAVAGFQSQQAKEAQAELQAESQRMDERNKVLSDRLRKFDETKTELAATEFQNPWFRQSAGRQIASAIAIGLGAYGQAMGGGPNVALQIITNQLDKDAEDQINSYKAKVGGLESQDKAIDNLRGIFKDEDSQRLALKSLKADAAVKTLEGINARFDGLAQTPKYQELMAGLMLKKQEYETDLAKKQADTITAQQNAMTKPGQKPENFVPGVGYMLTAKDAEDAKKLNALSTKTLRGIQELKAIRAEYGQELLNTDVAKRAKAIAADIQLDLKSQDYAQLGVLSGKDSEILSKLIPEDPTQFRDILPELNAAEEQLKKKVNSFYESRGAQQPGFIDDANAQVKMYPNGAQFQVKGNMAIPMNDIARQMEAEIKKKSVKK